MALYEGIGQTQPTGLPRTVEEMVRSGRLTPQQIQAASMPNILSMLQAPDQYKAELAHFLQRFVLDGYMRGVDVVSAIRADGGIKVGIEDIQRTRGSSARAIGTASSKAVYFDTSYWNQNTKYAAKLQTFYHEMAHSVLKQPHRERTSPGGRRGIMSAKGPSGGTGGWAQEYDWMMGELFNPGAPGNNQGVGLGGYAGAGYGQVGGFGMMPMMVMPTIMAPSISMQPTITMGVGGFGMGGFQSNIPMAAPMSPTIPMMSAAMAPTLMPAGGFRLNSVEPTINSQTGRIADLFRDPISQPTTLAPKSGGDSIYGSKGYIEQGRPNFFSQTLQKLNLPMLAG